MITRLVGIRQRGVTLIELMVAMALGLLVSAGIVTVFLSTSSSNQAQNQMARLQEEGRFAIERLTDDLSMANGQYCSNTGGSAKLQAASGMYLDGLRTPKIYGQTLNNLPDLTTKFGQAPYPAAPTIAYSMPAFFSMRGYDCDKNGDCTTIDPHSKVSAIPAAGATKNSRALGTDVLTLRYVDSTKGWSVVGGTGTTVTSANNAITSITLVPATGEPSAFNAGDLAMLADCSNAQVFAVTLSDGGKTLMPSTTNKGSPAPTQRDSAAKIFDFNTDFQTITYYVKLVDNGSGNGQFTGALIRRFNGTDEEIVRGVERLDFKYGVQDGNGNTRFLSAAEIDSGNNCPPAEPDPVTNVGCLWRAVKSIEVDILMDGQAPLHTLSREDTKYAYSQDLATKVLAAPDDHDVKPSVQGFDSLLLRREFRALVSVRNFNP